MEILQTPIKSESDKKSYRLIRLENGFKALLISKPSDQKSSKAAACLAVFVGSYENPPNVPGLAHFLEHMIFLDPGKYEAHFKDFIESFGGYCNAATANDFTKYEFLINEENFMQALIRFSELFIAPGLNKNIMKNERANVDSEFRLNKQNPSTRRAQVMRLYFNQNHHASRFPAGNLKTLKENITDDELHSELTKFLKNYVANKMALCIQSSKSLDELERLVVDNFSPLKRNDSIRLNVDLPIDFDSLTRPEFYSKIIYIKDLNENELTLSWLVPSAVRHYRDKTSSFLGRVFENDDEGGLIPYLKDKNLITNLTFTHKGWLSSIQFSCLRLSIDLTDEGFEKIEQVLSAVYSYLLMMKETPHNEYQRLHNDVRKDIDRAFKFQQETTPLSNVGVASRMDIIRDEDILRTNYVLNDYNEEVMTDLIGRLNEGKFNMNFLTNKREKFDWREEIYEVEYDEEDVPENYKNLWNYRKLNTDFYLERPNPYTVENFEVFTDNEELDHPEKIYKNEIIEVWHMLDRKYKQPLALIKMTFALKNFSRTAESFVCMRMLEKIASEIFTRKFAKSRKAGFSSEFSTAFDGIVLSFDGYNDKILVIIEKTLAELKKLINHVDEMQFNKECIEYKKVVAEYIQSARSVGKMELKKILSNNFFTSFETLKVLENINFEDFCSTIKDIFKEMSVVILAQGNIRKKDAMNIVELFNKYFDCQELSEDHRVIARGYKIPKGSHTLRMKSLHPTDDSSLIMNYYQIGPYSIHTKNLGAMIETFLDPKAFDFLRTKLQLSYSVNFSLMTLDNVLGFSIGARSNENNNDYKKVHGKIEEFISVNCREFIDTMSDEEFEALKKGRLADLAQPIVTLHAEFKTNLREIQNESYNFNRTQEAIDDAKKITKADLKEFYNSIFDPAETRKIIVHVIGKTNNDIGRSVDSLTRNVLTEKTEIDDNMITDVAEFQKGLYIYPISYN